MKINDLIKLLQRLISYKNENEWIEFKHNFHSPDEIGETISALSNGATLHNQPFAYLVFGIDNDTFDIVGTTFKPKSHKIRKEEIENWLAQRLNPRIDFRIFEFRYNSKNISIFEIPRAAYQPVEFSHKAYIRIGSINRILGDFPEKARKIWDTGNKNIFEIEIALRDCTAHNIISLLDTQNFFDLLKVPYPQTQEGVLNKLISENFIIKDNNSFSVTNLGALMIAKDLTQFTNLSRKSIRVVVYKNNSRTETLKDKIFTKGYAIGFIDLVNYVNDQLPQNEEITRALRAKTLMYPEIAIRELIANTILHQDFFEKGFPAIDIFPNRIEFISPGLPVITPIRFIDEYQSRNEKLADILRRVGICEEKGSGIDKVIHQCELYQLPAPNFEAQEKHTKVTIYSYKLLNKMDKNDKIRACYQHCCLKYLSNEKMTNQSLRQRFQIEGKNSALVSRIIKDSIEVGLIKENNAISKSRKYASYTPFWA